MSKLVKLNINGMEYVNEIDDTMTLLQFIRDVAGLTGTKSGCENGECGACTIIMDGLPVRSCIILAVEADNSHILTVEGLADEGTMHPLQQAFIEHGAVQCGFCIPGMLMASKALLDRNQCPSKRQISESLGGHLCRCGGYRAMQEAIEYAAKTIE